MHDGGLHLDPDAAFGPIAELPVDPSARVYELGWQTCSPSLAYRLTDRPWRPTDARNQLIGFRPGHVVPDGVFQGEGLLAVQVAPGAPIDIFAVADVRTRVPSVRARILDGRLLVASDGPVGHTRVDPGPGPTEDLSEPDAAMQRALAAWAEDIAAGMEVGDLAAAPSIWCSWYRYFDAVTEADIVENVAAVERLRLPVDVVQLDDGWQRNVGDWEPAGRFGSLTSLVGRVRDGGRRAGIWIAPFLVRATSEVARRHPDWLVQGDDGPLWLGRNWGDDLYALDSTAEPAWAHILDALRMLRGLGFDFFKLDFLYAGAAEGRRAEDLPAVAAYRAAMASIREAVGPDAHILGAGPLLPSVGLVDSMRVAPDIAIAAEPDGGDMSQPSVASAILTSRGRAFMHGRLFVNDADCLIARPSFDARHRWLDHLRRWGGLRGASDRLAELDGWGLEASRAWLGTERPRYLVRAGRALDQGSRPDDSERG